MYDRIQSMIHNQQEYSKSNSTMNTKMKLQNSLTVLKPIQAQSLIPTNLVMAEVNAEVKARSLSN